MSLSETGLSLGSTIRSPGRTITESDLVGFASLTGDWHPQHADAEWAADSRFGERIAHGMLVLSYSIGLVGFDPDRVVALRSLDGVTFKRPVRIGETIRVEATVADAKLLDPEHELIELAWKVLGADGKLVVRARVKVVHRVSGNEPKAADSLESDAEVLMAPADSEFYAGSVLL